MIDEYDPLTDDLIERLRRPKVTHHQISDAGEPYATTAQTHAVERIKLEAADALEAKDAEIAALKSRVGWTKEMGFILEGANADEIAAYDCGCTESLAAFTKILDGRDTGAGTSNEPWESVRRKALAMRADAERMDWLKNKLMAYDFAEHAILIKWPKGVDFKFGDLRGSIDAARGTAPTTKEQA